MVGNVAVIWNVRPTPSRHISRGFLPEVSWPNSLIRPALALVEGVQCHPQPLRGPVEQFRGGLAVILALVAFTTVNDLGSIGLWDRLQRLIG